VEVKFRIASFSSAVAVGVTVALSVAAPSAQAASPPAKPSGPVGQQDLAKLAATLEGQLGTRSAGSYLDKATGRLTVTVTDSSAAQDVRATGAIPRMVTRSGAELKAATDELYRSARIPGTSWAIDPASNQVVISVDESVTGDKLTRLKSVAAKLGAAARIEPVNGTLSTLDGPVMLDGTAIYTGGFRCSLGFNVFPIGGGEHYFITAGHCTHLGSTWYANSSLTSFLGTNSGSSGVFGPGGDYGIVHYEGSGIHVYGTVASTRQFIAGWGFPVVGESVQRSGSTTGVHGGTITATGTTVTYADGTTVTGLIKTTVCAESGDSGGPLYFQSTGLGLTSGGSGNCSSGGITYFQPIAPIMQNFAFQMWDTAQP
jgi:streptogrisin D